MIQIDYPPQNLPKMEQIFTHKFSYEIPRSIKEIEKMEKSGHFVILLPCEDGLIVIQRIGINEPNYPLVVTDHQ